MFNNPLRKYQSGGQVPSQEQQKMLMAFVEWLPKRVKEFANMAPEQIVEALNGMSKTPEGQKQVEMLMQQFQQEMQNASTSQFKNGGKLHDFICKHAKGGHVADCNCGVQKGQSGFALDDPYNKIVQNTIKRNADGSVSKVTVVSNSIGDAARQMITGTDTTSVGGYFFDNKFMPEGDATFNNQELEAAIKKIKMNQPPVDSQQNGGNISKRDALKAAMDIYGFDKNQARTAYANAKYSLRQQGARGKALRQAAREMISKRKDDTNNTSKIEAISNIPTITAGLSNSLSNTLAGSKPVMVNNYDAMSFNNAFRAARNIANNGGDKTFTWNGRTYGTNLATKNTPKLVDTPDIVVDEYDLSDTTPILDTTAPRVSMMGTTAAARSLRSITPTSFENSMPGAGQQVYSTMSEATKPTMVIPSINAQSVSNSVHPVQTSIGTGYYPDVPITEADILAVTNNMARNEEQRINQSRMPSVRWSDWSYQPISSVTPNSNISTKLSQPVANLVYQRNGGVVKGQNGISGGNVNFFGKITPFVNPVSTQPSDSAAVEYNPITKSLSFVDVNGNNVSWMETDNNSYTYRNGKDISDFNADQSEGFKPYGAFKRWNRATAGSTKLSDKDNKDLKKLKSDSIKRKSSKKSKGAAKE